MERRKAIKTHQPCTKCGSSDAVTIYEDGSWCYSCNTGSNNKPKKSIMDKCNTETIQEVLSYDVRGFEERKIPKDICYFFDVRVSYDDNRSIVAHYYPYPNGFKRRQLPKRFSWIGEAGGLFGMNKFPEGGKRVVICEGELDALAVAKASKDRYDKIYPVVAMSSATATKDVLEARDWLRSFGEVVIMMDNDEAGKVATSKLLKIVGIDKAKVVKYPSDCKDACDILLKKGSKELTTAIWDASLYKPSGIISTEDIWEALVKYNSMPSIPYPPCLDGLNSKLKGMRFNEIALFISGTGCLHPDTEVLMFDGYTKRARDVVIGDVLMGADNKPRNVLKLFSGTERMYQIKLTEDSSFVCNESHVLSLITSDKTNRVVDISVKDFLNLPPRSRRRLKAFKTNCLEYPEKSLLIHPYTLALYLAEVRKYDNTSYSIGDKLNKIGYVNENLEARLSGEFRKDREIIEKMIFHPLKRIPEIYLASSIDDRLELLAGFIDASGVFANKSFFKIYVKTEALANGIKILANSLGFRAKTSIEKPMYIRVSGENLSAIPTTRFSPKNVTSKKDLLRSGIEVIPLDISKYNGFAVDGDNRYVLGNHIVTHNSGKSTTMREIILHLLETTTDKVGLAAFEETPADSARKLAGMMINKNPSETEIPLSELKVGFDKVFKDDRLLILDHQGAIKDESIIDNLEYMALSGCKYIIIDHITMLTSEGIDGASGNEAVDRMMNELLRFVKRHEVWIGLVSHLRKTKQGVSSFEEGHLPTLDDIKGSGSIKQVSFDVIAFARNLSSSSDKERDETKMSVLKSRYTGLTGPVDGTIYNHQTGRLTCSRVDVFEVL